MSQINLALLTGIAAAFVLFLLIYSIRRKNRHQTEAQAEYLSGLNSMISGDKKQALAKLRNTVRLDTDFVDAYIKIGDILRDEGEAEKAVKIHRDLLIRPTLSAKQRFEILRSLASDYISDHGWKNALLVLEQILDIDHKNEWALGRQLTVYEEMGDWQGAYDIVKKSNRLGKTERKFRMAAYKLEQGVQLTHLKREHDARLRFRESIKEDATFLPAYLQLADSYIREQRAQDALVVLKKYIRIDPKNSVLIFSRLRQVLFELGHFSDIQTVFFELTRDHPEIVEGHLGLAEIYEKKGEFLRAVDACKRAIAVDPARIDHKLVLIRLYNKLSRQDAAAELANELANTLIEAKKRIVCTACGSVYDEYRYRCASCGRWNALEISRD
ncbi:tetratricopeptide repeat protein [candidate division KSB1 bacterium]|nr:tetratricopeptide repeat protein [candidate division KSB1 bacterium]